MKINKRFNHGDIVYWCHHNGNANYNVNFGIVDEQFSDGMVWVDYISPKERRLVDGIPLEEFESEIRFRKLPKGWTYNIKLFELTYREVDDGLLHIKIDRPDQLKEAYRNGLLVKDSTKFWGNIEEEITKEGFRIVKKYPMWEHHICSVRVFADKLYLDYESAKKEVDLHIADFTRQAALSDRDWSIEQIDKTLKLYQKYSDCSELEIKRYHDYFCSLLKVEDVETRVHNGHIQWKYWKNKRWGNLEIC